MMKTTGLVILLWYIIVKSQNCIFRFSWLRFFLVSTMGSFSCCSRSTVRKLHRRKRLQTFEPRLGMPRKKRGPIRRNWRRYRKWRAKVQSIKHGRHVFLQWINKLAFCRTEEKSDFDFWDEPSATTKPGPTRVGPGMGVNKQPRGSAKKKTTSLDGILSSMRRHRKLDQLEKPTQKPTWILLVLFFV